MRSQNIWIYSSFCQVNKYTVKGKNNIKKPQSRQALITYPLMTLFHGHEQVWHSKNKGNCEWLVEGRTMNLHSSTNTLWFYTDFIIIIITTTSTIYDVEPFQLNEKGNKESYLCENQTVRYRDIHI